MVFLDVDEQKVYSWLELEENGVEDKNMIQISEVIATPIEWIIEKGFRIKDTNVGFFLNLNCESVFIEFMDSPRHLYEPPVGFKWANDNTLMSYELDDENWAFRMEEIYELMISLVAWIKGLDEPGGLMA